MTSENIRLNIREEIKRGNECLAAAKHLLAGGFPNDAVSRSYYAAFHWARALLLKKELEPKTHRGVIQLIGLHFVKEGCLPEDAAASLSHLETFRELSDYNSSAEFSAQEARREIERAEHFIQASKPLLSKFTASS
jgi:uncharacterized protein (UPF0332 family)